MVAQTVEVPTAIEGLLRDLLHQVGDGEILDQQSDGEDLITTVMLDIHIDGVRYTLTRCLLAEHQDVALSPREKEVVRLVAKGFSNKTIAAVLDISPWTVSTHMRRIFAKMGIGSRTEMVTLALQEGLLANLS